MLFQGTGREWVEISKFSKLKLSLEKRNSRVKMFFRSILKGEKHRRRGEFWIYLYIFPALYSKLTFTLTLARFQNLLHVKAPTTTTTTTT
jgi:hypothetical protein